jgi:CRISPR type IV-associated protein Csf2
MAYRTEWYAGIVTALSSISHIGPDVGGQNVTSYLRREKFVQLDESVEMVPVISGNGMRGLLRDIGMWQMCKALGYGVNEETGEIVGLSLPAFHFLFSGGTLTGQAGRGLDVAAARCVRELIPLVGLFGGAMGNQIMEGKLKVGKLIPICRETAHLLPEWCRPAEPQSVYDMIQQEAFTRKDDEKNERLRQLIAPEVRALLEASAAEKAAKRGTAEERPDRETGQHQQMRYYVETLAAGTRFFWELALEDVTDIEYDAFWATLSAFAQRPYIGGKAGTGHGKVSINFRDWHALDPRQAQTTKMPDVPVGTRYQTHLTEQADAIRELLAAWQ